MERYGYMAVLLILTMSVSAYGQQQAEADDTEEVFVRVYENYLSRTELSLDMEISYSLSGKSIEGIPSAQYRVRRDNGKFFSDDGISVRIIDGNGRSLLVDRESREMFLVGESDNDGGKDGRTDYAEVLSQWTGGR